MTDAERQILQNQMAILEFIVRPDTDAKRIAMTRYRETSALLKADFEGRKSREAPARQ